jgi:hypothetical protein
MKVPKSYHEITVKQYVEAKALMEEDYVFDIERTTALISYFTGKPKEEIEELPFKQFGELQNNVKFMYFDLPSYQVNDIIKIDGFVFEAVKSLTKMNVAQKVDFLTTYKLSGNDLGKCIDKLLPIIYTNGKYNVEQYEQNKDLLSKAKISEVSGLVFFYSDYWHNAERIIANYTESQTKIVEERMKWISENNHLISSLSISGGSIQ